VNKPLGKTLALLLLIAAGMLLAVNRAAAEDPKPALTIAFAGYDTMNADLKVLDQIDGHLGLAKKLEGYLQAATKGKNLAGLDKSRPWGVLVTIGESDEPITQGYLPVSDLKQLVEGLPAPGGEAPKPNADGLYEIPNGGKTIYAKQKGTWAVLSDNEEALKSAPADPASMISDLSKKYLVAVRGNVQNIPAARRDQFISAMRGLVTFGLAAQGGSDEQQAMQRASVKQIFDQLEKLSKELDTLVIGLGIDASTKSLFLDVETRAVAGSEMAAKCAAMKDAKTNFAGFAIPGAAMTMLAAGTTTDGEVAQAKQTLQTLKTSASKQLDDNEELGDKRREVAKQLLNDAFDVLQKTIALKKSDAGASVVLQEGPAVVYGMLIADGTKLDATVKKLVKELVTEKPELKDMIKLDAEEYEGAKFHVVTIPTPPGNGREVFGDSVQVVVGLSDSRLYIAAGKEPMAVLKKAIAASKDSADKAIPPMEMVISAESIAKFVAKVTPEGNPNDAKVKKQAGKFAEQLAKTSGKDRVTITVQPIDNGAVMRLSVDPGVTKTLMQMIGQATHAGGDESAEEN
jgi:hypothetical protein